MQAVLEIGGRLITPGTRTTIDLVLPRLNSRTDLSMPVHVIHGRRPGPRLFVTSAIHGDEINGIEICQRLLESRALRSIRGTLLVVPVVNVYGVIHQSRYLPDRRDLNRSFPGSERGSLAGRVANLLLSEVIARCSHGIDLHTGAVHRTNLPQIRADLSHLETASLAESFGVPVLLDASLREGSLREAAARLGVPMLLYEAGEALRYDELSIRAGLQGVINVMRELGMLRPSKRKRLALPPFVAKTSNWVRAPESGMLRNSASLGIQVEKGDLLAAVSDPYSQVETPVLSPYRGIIIGRTQIPLVHEGEALFHIARFKEDIDEISETLDTFESAFSDDPEVEMFADAID